MNRRLLMLTIAASLFTCIDIFSVQTATHSSWAGAQRPRPWDKVRDLPLGSEAPDWQLKTVASETVTLSGLRGNVVVLDFWANWCGPCRQLEPLLDQLSLEYQDKRVRFFTVSIWPDEGFDPRRYLKEHKMASTFLIGTDAVARDYGIWGLPTYFVIDRTGKISYIHMLLSVNSEALGRKLREAVDEALAKDPNGRSN